MEQSENWIAEASVIVDSCKGDENTLIARMAGWIDTAAQNQGNAEYYRSLVEKCGEAVGKEAYICDDGTMSQDVLCAKVPELVEEICEKRYGNGTI